MKKIRRVLSGLACGTLSGGVYCTATAASEPGVQWGWLLAGGLMLVIAVQLIVELAQVNR